MSPHCSRRVFLSNLALSAAVPRNIFNFQRSDSGGTPYLAFVGRAFPGQPHLDRIETYRVDGGRWTSFGNPVDALRPQALALHPRLPIVYAAHATAEHGNLPRGSISAFAFDAHAGDLSLLSHQPLALSATHPDRINVSPDGRMLMVAASTGGVWNLVHLNADGTIKAAPTPIKLTGSGPHPSQCGARPHSAVFHLDGRCVYATDFGSDHIDTIELSELDDCRSVPTLANRLRVKAGSGPGQLFLHPSGKLLVVAKCLGPAFTVFRVAANGRLEHDPADHCPVDGEHAGAVACSSSGDMFYFATLTRSGETKLSVLVLSESNGKLQCLQSIDLGGRPLPTQMIAFDDELLLLNNDGIEMMPLDRHSGLRSGAISKCVLRKTDLMSLAALFLRA